MKRLTYIFGLAAAITLSSCDSLNLAPEDFYGSNNFWQNKAQVEGFAVGLHNDLRSSNTMLFVLGEARGGTQRSGTSSLGQSLDYSAPIKNNTLTKDNTGVSNWYSLYPNIMQVNHMIENVEKANYLTDADKGYYLGQAYGLRAYYYFMLYRTFGGVPLITKVDLLKGGQPSPSELYAKRAKPEEVLNLIKEDVKRSEENFAGNTTKNAILWTKDATLMLKAEVYLWSAKTNYFHTPGGKADLNIAKTALSAIISGGRYSLLNDYAQVFTQKGNAEVIFALRFQDNEATNWGNQFTYASNLFENQKYSRDGQLYGDVLDLKGANSIMRHEYKHALWSSYDATDSRRDKIFLDYYDKANQEGFGVALRKSIGSINANQLRIYDTDMVIYRYADALLMMAEVANGLGEDCAPYINQVRQRAYGSNFNASVTYVDNHNYAANELAILHERDKEFVWEGKRWFDVVRMRDANGESLVFSPEANYPNNEALSTHVPLLEKSQKYMLLWPVDVNTLNNDPELKQTPGYGGTEESW